MVGSPFAWIVCLASRFLPHIPNVEPILVTQMLISYRHSATINFLFASSNIICLDLLTAHIGPWTLITAASYGLLGIAATYYFRRPTANYVTFAFLSTITYDFVTCIVSGPLLFGQSVYATLLAQIPFSCAHLVGNLLFALVLQIAVEVKTTNHFTKKV